MNITYPIKALFSRLAPVDNWNFLGSASLTVVVDRMDINGDWKERVTITSIGTTVVSSAAIFGGKLSDTAWLRIVSISGGTLYALPARNALPGQVLSSTTGWVLTAGDRVGLAPNTGTSIASLSAVGVIGATMPALREKTVTFSLDTNIYAAGDVLADRQIIAACVSADDANGYLVGMQILDEDDQAAAGMTVVFLSDDVSLGTENAAVSITDANARHIIGVVPIASGDWVDLINSKLVTKVMGDTGLPMAITPKSGTDDIYVALITAGTPTQTASGITARFWFQDCI